MTCVSHDARERGAIVIHKEKKHACPGRLG